MKSWLHMRVWKYCVTSQPSIGLIFMISKTQSSKLSTETARYLLLARIPLTRQLAGICTSVYNRLHLSKLSLSCAHLLRNPSRYAQILLNHHPDGLPGNGHLKILFSLSNTIKISIPLADVLLLMISVSQSSHNANANGQ